MNIDNLEILEVEEPPVNIDEIKSVEKKINKVIPDVYKSFLLQTNGAVMDYCVLYGTERIVMAEEIHDMKKYAPQYVCIGNDNGDYELVMKAENNAVLCGFMESGSMGIIEPEWFDFEDWVNKGCPVDLE